MNIVPLEDSSWYAPLISAAAESCARRELAAVRAATATGHSHALAHAFAAHRTYLIGLLSWTDFQSDRYCVARLQQLAAGGIPTDDLVYLRGAAELTLEIMKGESHESRN